MSITEATREKIESELMQANRDKKELVENLNQATRERDGYHDELLQVRRELDRQSSNVVRLAREKEDLTKEKSNLIVQVTGAERDNRALSEACLNSFVHKMTRCLIRALFIIVYAKQLNRILEKTSVYSLELPICLWCT